MSWHTPHPKTATRSAPWHYHAHIVAPIELLLNYELKSLYLLKISKKPIIPSNQPCSLAPTGKRRFLILRRTKTNRRHRLAQCKKQPKE